MFGAAWSILGTVILLVTLIDAFWTTLTVSRAGWLSAYLAGSVGRIAMKGPRRIAENASLLALCTSFLLWFLLLWAGWTMFFCGSPDAVVDTMTTTPANLVGRIYYAGFTLTTLGVGDLRPGEGVWRLATVLAATSGFIILTLFITYALSVMTALNDRRSLGAAVGNLGPAPQDLLSHIPHGGIQALTTRLLSLTDRLESAAIQTDAYPVLEYSHENNPQWSFARAVVTLGEVSLLLEHVSKDEHASTSAVWLPLRNAVNLIVSEKHASDNSVSAPAPPFPDLEALCREGIASDSQAKAVYERPEIQMMRGQWSAWLKWHNREWSLIYPVSRES